MVKTRSQRHRQVVLVLATVLALVLNLLPNAVPGLPTPTASAHNLQTKMASFRFDPNTLAMLDARIESGSWIPPQPLLQVGDEIGLIIKGVPRDGTNTGVGGYLNFFVPNGVTVLDAAYLLPGNDPSDGLTGYDKVPMKGQSPIAIGDGPIGAHSTPALVGLTLGPNVNGVTEAAVDGTGLHRGTIAGVYGDTGIFYSTHPDTAWNTWVTSGGYDQNTGTSDNTIANNSGDVVVPLNKWDAEQLLAYGAKSPAAPIVDPNGRGNAPWGNANGVAGPQSGYGWDFDWDFWRASAKDAAAMRAASDQFGPWQRITYAGSRVSKDQAGLTSTTLGYASSDAVNLGFALSPTSPLAATVSQTDNTSPKAIRWSIGQTVLNRPELVWVKIRVNDTSAILNPDGCPYFYAGAFGGDAGGSDNGKDHLWRYYEPSYTTWNGCLAIHKSADKEITKVGDTLRYTIKVYNAGSSDLSQVIIRDTLPSGVSFISAVPAQSSGPNPLVWNVGTLLRGQKFEAVVTVKVTGSGPLENSVTATGQTPGGSPVSSDATEITPSGAIPWLRQTKSVNPSSVAPGGTVQYTIQIDNIGTGATGSPLTIQEYLPAGFTFVSKDSVTVNGANVTASTTVNTSPPTYSTNQPLFTVPTAINAGQALVLKFTAQVGSNVSPGGYCNYFTTTESGIPQTTGSLGCVTVGGGQIGDTIFRDWNNNGVQDAGEEGIPGITVQLNGVATAVTDANGKYLFSGLTAGNYTVDVISGIPAGYTLTTPPEPRSVTLATNEANLNVDFGYKPGGVGSIGDKVFEDIANDGLFNGADVGIDGVTVTLYEDTNGNGVLDAGQDVQVATTLTTGGGNYSFTGLDVARSYLVVTSDSTGSAVDTHFANAYTTSTGNPQKVSPADFTAQGNVVTDADFGYFGQTPGSIGDTVCIDTNRNGLCDAGEQGIAHVTINVYNDINSNGVADPGEPMISTTTSITGSYIFSGLGPGSYLVAVDQTDPDIPGGYATSVGQYNVNLNAGQTYLTADFPFIQVLTKSVDKSTASPGNTLNYTIIAAYPGPALLSDVIISDTIPAGTAYVANSVNADGVYSPTTNTIEWSLGSNTDAIPGLTAAPGSALCPVVTTLNPVADTFIDLGNPTKNNGGNTLLITRPANVSSLKYTLLRFDTSSIPSGALIQSAIMGLDVQSTRSSNHFDKVYRMKTTWTEGTGTNDLCGGFGNGATWNAPNCTGNWAGGGAFSSADYDSALLGTLAPKTKGYKTVNVASAVDAWVNGGVANRGLVLVSTGTDGGDGKYYNRENTTANTDPYLRVTYLLETLGGCSGPTVLTAAADTYVDIGNATKNYGQDTALNTKENGSTQQAGLLYFDLTAVPADAIISSAVLTVTITAGSSNGDSDGVYRTLTPWVEGSGTGQVTNDGATWNTRNGTAAWTAGTFGTSDYDASSPLGSIVQAGNNQDYAVTVTSVVQNWLNNGAPNNGFALIPFSNGGVSYGSKEAAKPAKLQVNWTLPPNPGGQTKVTLSATPVLQGQTGQVQVTMVVTATNAVADITPPANLNVTGVFAAATKVSGPTPAGPIGIAAGGAAIFTYVYNVTPSSIPGLVTFSGKPTSASAQFATGFSPGVLVSPPLAFQVTVNNPAGVPYIQNSAVIEDASLLAGGVASPPAVTSLSASIGDRVWADLNGNGIQDVGEPGLNAVQVCATPTGGGAVVCATTDALGNYRIFGLTNNAGYNVTLTPATLPANYQPTTPTTLTRTATTAGVNDADFGLRPPGTASIGDTVWLDANENGSLDGSETGLPNITIKLYKDLTNNGLTNDDILMATTTSDANGNYLFGGLYTGDYLVQVDPASAVTTPYGVATTLGAAMNLTSGSTNPHDVTLTNGQAYTTADFGYDWGGSIGDRLWYDNDGDKVGPTGTPGGGDSSEPYVASGGVLNLYYDSNGDGAVNPGEPIVAVALSDGTGAYLFDNLPPGNYVVKAEEQQIPAPPSSPNAGQIGRMVATTGSEHTVALAGNQAYVNADFGFIEAAEVAGHVFHDANHNGVLDAGEALLANVTVTLSGTDVNNNPVSLTTTTNGAGEYSFIAPPGNYTITYNPANLPTGLTEATTPTSITLSVNAGAELASNDFGVDNAGKIGDLVWVDANGNGTRDAGEPGLAGVTVNLYDSTGTTLLATTVTTVTGGYLFPGLPDGSYRVDPDQTTVPTGYTLTTSNDPDPATVSGGGSDLASDFGYRPPGTLRTISGRIYSDANNNNNDDGEPGFANVDVAVLCDTGVFTVRSDGTGAWSISGIKDGSVCTILDADDTDLPRAAYAPTETPGTPITVNANLSGLDFGYNLQPASISGTVCVGSGDGLCNSEPPIQGVTITLRYAGVDGILNTVDDVVTTQQTNASGDYSFTNLDAGLYAVSETNLPNFNSLADADGGNPDNISVALAVGQNKLDRDFEDVPIFVGHPSYTLSKQLNGASPVRTGEAISFTIRITNTGDVTITVLPLRDSYDIRYLAFTSATPAPTDNTDDGQLDWSDLTASFGDLPPGAHVDVLVRFNAWHDTTLLLNSETINRASAYAVLADPDGAGPIPAFAVPDTPPADAGVGIQAPTAVTLAEYKVTYADGQVQLFWRTENEAQVLSFNVMRVDEVGNVLKLNAEPIVAQKSGQSAGTVYTYADGAPAFGHTYRYVLEVTDLAGQVSYNEVGTVTTGRSVFLPVISKR